MSGRYVFTAVVFVLWAVGFYLASDFSGFDIIGELSHINPLGIFGGFLTYLMAVGTGIFILYRCLRYVGLRPPVIGVAKAWIFGSFIDNIVPTVTPLGEATMAYFLERFYRISYTKSLAAIGMYVSSWALSVSVFSALAVILTEYFIGIPHIFLIPIVIMVALFSLITAGWLLLLTKKRMVERVVCRILGFYNRIYNRIKRRKVTFDQSIINMEFEKSYKSLEELMRNKLQIMTSVLFFIVPQLAHVLCIYLIICVGFGMDVSIWIVLIIHIVASVAGLISFIPSGFGVYEAVASGALTMGIPGSIAVAAILIYRLIFVWTTNFVGGLIGIVEGIENPGKVVGTNIRIAE